MRLGFIFDIRFFYYEGHYYSSNLTEQLWNNRYLKVFDEIVVIGRKVTLTENPSNKMTRADIEHVQFRCIDDVSRARRLVNQKAEAEFILRAIQDCDYIISRSWWGIPQCKKLNKPYMIEIISCAWDVLHFHSSPFARIAALPNYLLMRNAVADAPFVNYVTEHFLQRRYPTRGRASAISDVQMEPVTDTVLEKRIKRIKAGNALLVLGTAGALDVEFKGQQQVIYALSLLKKEGFQNFLYQIVGNGTGERLEELAKKLDVSEQVQVLGEIPHCNMAEWYDGLDIYIHPSRAEGLSRAIIEAEMHGLLCIVSDAGGNSELIEQQFVFSNGKHNEQEIANILKSITVNQMLNQAKRNFDFAKKFDCNVLDDKWVSLLQRFSASR